MHVERDGIIRSDLLQSESWLEHGFGTRHSQVWPERYFRVRQTHSDRIVKWGDFSEPPEADAVVSDAPGEWIGIRTADCVPVLLADPVHQCVAAVHAGWRGTVASITAKTVVQMREEFGTDPENLIAAIGPCIGSCCFEVGPEVAAEFGTLFPEKVILTHFDLAEANRRQLTQAGVPSGQIDQARMCTACSREQFESFRRDREHAGRMVSSIRRVGSK